MYALWEAGILAIERARKQAAATVALKNCSHTGRLGHVVEHMATEGCFAQIMGGGGRHKWPGVAPYGGCEAMLCTNPYAFGMPGGKYGPVVTDFATSAVSEGTISNYQAAGKQLPEGCILDKSGHPSTSPDDYFDGGVHLPAAGHKGYGMAVISELLGGIALNTPPEFNWIITAIDIAQLRDKEGYVGDTEKFLDQVKSVKVAPGHKEILIPGERGNRRSLLGSKEGVILPQSVYDELVDLAQQHGVSFPEKE
jgi:LDH2 family malate/lactate/ureidoglycolate dehydrogenase